MIGWLLAPNTQPEDLGPIPSFLSEEDPRDAKTQFNANYPYGGSWRSKGITLDANYRLCYPGDPPEPWLAATFLREETILLYPSSFIVILQPDGSLQFQRMD